MNREIKFRVWDSILKNFNDSAENWDRDAVELYCPPRANLNEALDDILNDCEDRYIIQQFTGLLDEDGKEIFEGDFVRMKSHCSLRQSPYADEIIEIKWLEDYCSFNISKYADAKFWIVANIMENPEFFKIPLAS